MGDYLFSYATPEDPPVKRGIIRLIEKSTGQPRLKALYLHNQNHPRPNESFWAAAVRSLDLDVQYDRAALAKLPKRGPLVVVANHPYGVLDGIVISWLIEKVRPDFHVLTNAVLMRAPEVRKYVLPVDFSGSDEAMKTNIASRAAARAALERGEAVVIFPAGGVSTTPDRWGRKPAVDAPWQPFVSQLVQRAQAPVVPVWFGGQNSRLFQVASHLSLTLRLSLIFHEVRTRIGASLPVQIGPVSPYAEFAEIKDRQQLADALRERTYALAPTARVPKARHARKLLAALKRLKGAA
jgi:putative hemolysin